MTKKWISGALVGVLLAISITVYHNGIPGIIKKRPPKIAIAASIYPIADLVKNIGGDRVDVHTVLPDGLSPHTVNPDQLDRGAVRNARIVFQVGYGLEPWMDKLLAMANRPPLLITLSDGIAPITHKDHPLIPEPIVSNNASSGPTASATSDVRIDDHDDISDSPLTMGVPSASARLNANPHTWLNPLNALHMCEVIANTLSELDPAYRDYYEANFLKYQTELRKLDQITIKTLSPFSHRKYIALHDAWEYFDRRYITQCILPVEETPGQYPSISQEKRIYDAMDLYGIKIIFIEPQLSQAPIHKIASQAHCTLLTLDPIGGQKYKNRNTYLKMMTYNLNQMKQAFN